MKRNHLAVAATLWSMVGVAIAQETTECNPKPLVYGTGEYPYGNDLFGRPNQPTCHYEVLCAHKNGQTIVEANVVSATPTHGAFVYTLEPAGRGVIRGSQVVSRFDIYWPAQQGPEVGDRVLAFLVDPTPLCEGMAARQQRMNSGVDEWGVLTRRTCVMDNDPNRYFSRLDGPNSLFQRERNTGTVATWTGEGDQSLFNKTLVASAQCDGRVVRRYLGATMSWQALLDVVQTCVTTPQLPVHCCEQGQTVAQLTTR